MNPAGALPCAIPASHQGSVKMPDFFSNVVHRFTKAIGIEPATSKRRKKVILRRYGEHPEVHTAERPRDKVDNYQVCQDGCRQRNPRIVEKTRGGRGRSEAPPDIRKKKEIRSNKFDRQRGSLDEFEKWNAPLVEKHPHGRTTRSEAPPVDRKPKETVSDSVDCYEPEGPPHGTLLWPFAIVRRVSHWLRRL